MSTHPIPSATVTADQGALAAAMTLRNALQPDQDYAAAQAHLRTYAGLKAALDDGRPRHRVAVLGGYGTTALTPLVELYLFGHSILADTLDLPYGVFRQEVLDPRIRALFLCAAHGVPGHGLA